MLRFETLERRLVLDACNIAALGLPDTTEVPYCDQEYVTESTSFDSRGATLVDLDISASASDTRPFFNNNKATATGDVLVTGIVAGRLTFEVEVSTLIMQSRPSSASELLASRRDAVVTFGIFGHGTFIGAVDISVGAMNTMATGSDPDQSFESASVNLDELVLYGFINIRITAMAGRSYFELGSGPTIYSQTYLREAFVNVEAGATKMHFAEGSTTATIGDMFTAEKSFVVSSTDTFNDVIAFAGLTSLVHVNIREDTDRTAHNIDSRDPIASELVVNSMGSTKINVVDQGSIDMVAGATTFFNEVLSGVAIDATLHSNSHSVRIVQRMGGYAELPSLDWFGVTLVDGMLFGDTIAFRV